MRRGNKSVRGLLLCVLAVLALCAPAGAYTRNYLYEDGGAWCNVRIATDWSGQTYFMLYDAAGTTSRIYAVPADFSGRKEDLNLAKPFMTIPGRARFLKITTDRDASYVYYTLAGDSTHLYRLPLKRGYTGQPEVRDFTLGDSAFVFAGFSLAKDPDQVLLVSKASAQREVTIGLFSFSQWSVSGSKSPIRTWTCTLPAERHFVPLNEWDVGYTTVYEASTGKVWLSVKQTDTVVRKECYKWFFHADIGTGGGLRAFDPAAEVPGWNEDKNFKELLIGSYQRSVGWTNEPVVNRDFVKFTVYNVGTGGRMTISDQTDTWTDQQARDFWSGGKGAYSQRGHFVDARGRLYVIYNSVGAEGKFDFVRILCLSPASSASVAPPLLPKDAGPQPADAVVLTALPFSGPDGYVAVGSRWEVYAKTGSGRSASGGFAIRSVDGREPVYKGSNTDGSPSHKVAQVLPAGDYEWRMSYDYRTGSEGAMVRASPWSEMGSLTVTASSDPTPKPTPDPSTGKGGGGCDTGFAGLALLLAAPLFLRRR